MSLVRRLVAAGVLTTGVLVVPALAASAHPLGNFTINHFSGLHVDPGGLTVDLVTDMAEIPTFQARPGIDTNHDGKIEPNEADSWRKRQCTTQAASLTVTFDARRVPLTVLDAGALSFPPGQAGLDTLRLECGLRAHLTGARVGDLSYQDNNFHGRLGWHEVIATAAGGATLLGSDVAPTSVSNRLTHYPADLLRSPLNQRTANLRVDLGPAGERSGAANPATSPAVALPTSILPRGVDRATRAFTSLVARQHLTLLFALVAAALAVLLGAIHALAPGHGKTVMAAYLVGERGSVRQAALIGLTVTATHTTGVLVLGVVLTSSSIVAPERLYPWLGLASGLMLACIGAGLLLRATRNPRPFATTIPEPTPNPATPSPPAPNTQRVLVAVGAPTSNPQADTIAERGHATWHGHDHDLASPEAADHDPYPPDDPRHQHPHVHHPHPHGHDEHEHPQLKDPHRPAPQNPHHRQTTVHSHSHGGKPHAHPIPPPDQPLRWRSLIAMGFAGGMVPSPSALVVLLGAVALRRVWFGLILVVAYGLGMAATLTTAGLLLDRARRLLERNGHHRSGGPLVTLGRWLPTVTATIIVIVGLGLAARGAAKI